MDTVMKQLFQRVNAWIARLQKKGVDMTFGTTVRATAAKPSKNQHPSWPDYRLSEVYGSDLVLQSPTWSPSPWPWHH